MQVRQLKLTRVQLAQALFLANAVIWVLIGAATVLRMAGGSAEQRASAVVIAILMLGNAGAMLVSAVGLGRRSRLLCLFAIAVLVVNIILTVTDQIGLLDVLTGALDVVLLVLVISMWGRYAGRGR
jgi:hypothetical protein